MFCEKSFELKLQGAFIRRSLLDGLHLVANNKSLTIDGLHQLSIIRCLKIISLLSLAFFIEIKIFMKYQNMIKKA